MIRFIVAVDRKLGMAKNGIQPWWIPADEKYFLDQTSQYGANVLMGSKTFEVIGHPLKDRHNYVASRDVVAAMGSEIVSDLDGFVRNWQQKDLWIIGGAAIFEQTLKYADELYVTHIEADFKCDVFFPKFSDSFMLFNEEGPSEDNGFIFRYSVYVRK